MFLFQREAGKAGWPVWWWRREWAESQPSTTGGGREPTTVNVKRCTADGCGRFVRTGETFCRTHEPPVSGGETGPVWRLSSLGSPPLAKGEGEDDEETAGERRRRAEVRFRRRLKQGDYQSLFEGRLKEVIAQAAAERSLTDEIGALRFVLARLLAEEEDVTKLATSVARVATVAIQAARTQRAISGELADGLTEALTQILTELDG